MDNKCKIDQDKFLPYFESFIGNVQNRSGNQKKYAQYPGYVKRVKKRVSDSDTIILNTINFLGKTRSKRIIDALEQLTDVDKSIKDGIVQVMKKHKRVSDSYFKDAIYEYINKITDENSKKKLLCTINEVYHRANDPIDYVMKFIEEKLNKSCTSKKLKPKSIENYCSGFRKYAQVLIGFYHAKTAVEIDVDNDLIFCELIVKNVLCASQEVFKAVKEGRLGTDENIGKANKYASWDYMKSARKTHTKKGDKVKTDIVIGGSGEFVADDNSNANKYIKMAILESYRRKYPNNPIFLNATIDSLKNGYEACHIWDLPGDRRYYTSIGNLVLVPRALAQLTDHNKAVKNLLRYEAIQRFDFQPDDKDDEEVSEPKNYDKYIWRDGSTNKEKF